LLVFGICVALSLASAAAGQEVSARLSQLHDALHLIAEQEEAWRDYVAAVGPNAQMEARHHATEQLLPQLTTPRRIALIDATMAQDSADFHRQSETIEAFYARLSPDQQRTFDRQTLPRSSARSGSTEADPDGAAPGRPLRMPPDPDR
jgi:hypothetical protein